jgi:predicted lipid-binding transport protein (Tim44 family)
MKISILLLEVAILPVFAILNTMKRSLQEVVELVVFGLIALLIGTGLLWLVGWLLGMVSVVFIAVAGWIWQLLRFIIPVALVAGVIFFIYRVVTNRSKPAVQTASAPTPPVTEPVAKVEVEKTEEAMPPSSDDRMTGESKDTN